MECPWSSPVAFKYGRLLSRTRPSLLGTFCHLRLLAPPPLETLRRRESLPRNIPSGEERGDTAVFAGQFSRSFSLNFASNDIFREHFDPISYPCGVAEVWLRPDPGDDLQKGLNRLKDAKNRHAGIWVILSITCGVSLVCFN